MARKRFRAMVPAMERVPYRVPGSLLLVLCGACGAGSALVTPATFATAFAQAVCQVQSRCRQESAFLEQQCEDDASAVYSADLAKAIAAGKSAFNAQQAQACVDGLRARGCQRTPPEVDQACERAVTGTIAAGSACSWLYECATGRCEPAGPGACPAQCGPVGAEGAPCSDGPCDLRAGLRCIDNVCSKLHAADQKCGSTDDCALDLYCDGFGKCSSRTFEQASCDADEQCAAGLWCDASAEGGLCRKQIAPGASCTAASAESIRSACEDGSVCKGFTFAKTGATAGTCTALGELGAGCVASAEITGCGGGLACVGGKCADKPVSGPCAQPDDCKDGVAFCDGTACQLLKTEGATCASSPECASHFCEPSSGTCVDSDPSCHEP
jgi:hypothetical protein